MLSDPKLLGASPVVERLRHEIDSAARSEASILVEGETGVGKDVVARLIHGLGRRASRRFVALNCAALPDALLESELFGHMRGSFTGAYRDKIGLAVQADGGTLFLDEVGEMSSRMQAVLLRFVESGEIQPVGSERQTRSTDVRIISATNRSLAAQIATGAFRADLYYRLNVIRLIVPPLRERSLDVLVLLKQFLADAAQLHQAKVPLLAPDALEALTKYRWPGNIRELKNLAEQMVVRGLARPLERSDLPIHIALVPSPGTPIPAEANLPGPAVAADRAFDRVVKQGETFWKAVHEVFMDHELTKTDVRMIVRRGLEQTHGSYRGLAQLFHLSPREYRRFLAFLHQHDCHVILGPSVRSQNGDRPVADRTA
jgi:DNA-binding NtrC family response regulator